MENNGKRTKQKNTLGYLNSQAGSNSRIYKGLKMSNFVLLNLS